MKKIIIFCRCSTSKQDITAQQNETIAFAKGLKYTEDQFIFLGGVGLSAYKVDTMYQKSIEQLKQYIISGTIEAIVVYHLNRLARNEVIAMEIKQLCVEHKVNILVKEPQLRLLNDDKTLNEGFELAYSLFCTLNMQSARELRVKTLRGKIYKKSLSKYSCANGGSIPLGYRKENGVVVIDDENASTIRYIYELCLNGYSVRQIINELIESRKVVKISPYGIKNILHNNKYYDDTMYPPIINKDTFDKVQQTLTSNYVGASKSFRKYHFGNRIIKCSCGYNYCVNNDLYDCHNKRENKDVLHTKSISVHIIDGILFSVVNDKIVEKAKADIQKNKINVVKKIDVLNQKTIKLSTQIGNYKSKFERLFEGYVDGEINKETYNLKKQELSIKENELKNKLVAMESELQHLTNLLTDNEILSLYDTNNALSVQKAIRQYVDKVTFVDGEITIYFKDKSIFQCYYFNKIKKDNKIFADRERTKPLYIPTIIHKGETFEIKQIQTIQQTKKG